MPTNPAAALGVDVAELFRPAAAENPKGKETGK
jgi:hypothetical protein